MAFFKIDGRILHIGGDISVGAGDSLVTFFRTLPIPADTITVDLNTLETWDTSSIQVMLAWTKSIAPVQAVWKHVPAQLVADIKLLGLQKMFGGVGNE